MDLLGTTDQDRKREFPMYEKDEWPFDGKVWDLGRKYSWFAVYHLNGMILLLRISSGTVG